MLVKKRSAVKDTRRSKEPKIYDDASTRVSQQSSIVEIEEIKVDIKPNNNLADSKFSSSQSWFKSAHEKITDSNSNSTKKVI